jgi:hypothetical protein
MPDVLEDVNDRQRDAIHYRVETPKYIEHSHKTLFRGPPASAGGVVTGIPF